MDLGNGPGVAISLLFQPGDALTPQTVTVAAHDDVIAEVLQHNGTIDIAAVSADPRFNGSLPTTSIQVLDDDFLTPLISTTANDPTNLPIIPVTIDFGQNVTGFQLADVSVSGAVAANFNALDGRSYSLDLVPIADGILTLGIAAAAATDNGGKDSLAAVQFTTTSDRTSPAAQIVGPPNPTHLDPFSVEIDFAEVVNGFAADDLQLTNATVAGFIDEGNGRFTVSIDADADGSVSVDVLAGGVTDQAGNANVAGNSFSTVVDTTDPVITAPPDVVVEGDIGGGASINNAAIAAFLAGATASDNIDPSVTITHDAPSTFALGDTSVTFTATDDVGNATSATAVVTVVDTTSPQLTAPADIVVEGDAIGGALASNAAVTAFLAAASATDVVDDSVTITHDLPAGVIPPGDTIVTFTGTDDHGNSSVAIATITVVDTTNPNLSAPADIAVEGDTETGALANNASIAAFLAAATATDIVDSDVTISHDAPTGIFPLGTTLVSFTATDDTGNFATASANVTVIDSTAPSVVAPANITLEGDVIGGATVSGFALSAFLAGASATDIVDADVTITHDVSGSVLPLGLTTVTFTATDDSGNSSNATATVTVVDTTAPELTAPQDAAIEGNVPGGASSGNAAIVAFLVAATATDLVDAEVTITTDAPAAFFPLGTTIVTFTATDDQGNLANATAELNVVDTTAPVLTVPADVTVEADTAAGVASTNAAIVAFLASATAVDLVDTSVEVSHDSVPSFLPLGSTIVSFTATDDFGNESTLTSTINVVDQTSPVVTAPSNIVLEGDTAGGALDTNPGIAAFLAGASVVDVVDQAVTINNDAPAVFPRGVTTVTFSGTDDSGNTGQATATVTVVDTTDPSLTVPASISVEADELGGSSSANAAISAFLAGASASDVVDQDVAITHDAPQSFGIGSTTVTFTAADDVGNEVNGQATVTVLDTTAPSFTLPADIAVEGDSTGGAGVSHPDIVEFLQAISAVDIVDGVVAVANDAPTFFGLGETLINVTASDATGNQAAATVRVTIVDTAPPSLIVPTDVVVEGDTTGGAAAVNTAIVQFLNAASGTDVVDPNVIITNDAPAVLPVGDSPCDVYCNGRLRERGQRHRNRYCHGHDCSTDYRTGRHHDHLQRSRRRGRPLILTLLASLLLSLSRIWSIRNRKSRTMRPRFSHWVPPR